MWRYSVIYHFDTSDQREKPVYKSHIAKITHTYMCNIKNIAHLISLKNSTTSSKYFDIRDESAILYIVTQIGFDCGFQILSL